MKKLQNLIKAGLICSAVIFSTPVFAVVIYDNSANDLTNRFHTATTEVGDEIILAGTQRFLTHFSFEYFGLNAAGAPSFSGTVLAQVRFYLNDGAPFNGYATPSTKFFDSGLFAVTPTTRSTVNFNGSDLYSGNLMNLSGPIPVASNFTWSVQFQLSNLSDDVGVDLYSPPVIGQDRPDYWEKSGLAWSLKTNNVPVDFASRFEASATGVPDAANTAQLLGGMMALLVGLRLRKR